MFKIESDSSEFPKGILISRNDSLESIQALFTYYSIPGGRGNFSGLALATEEVIDAGEVVEIETLQVVVIKIAAPSWYEIERWIGWTCDDGVLSILRKDVVEAAISIAPIGDYLNFDISTISSTVEKELTITLTVTECESIQDIERILSQDEWISIPNADESQS
mgnify:CR=1 FL=1